jgi:group II intron reverse transcriptase/maturase
VTVDLLRWSFYQLKRRAAAGIDGVTWDQYETDIEGNLADLYGRVQRGAYRAKPSRRQYIPKPDGRQRPLGIAALEDKIVQRAVVEILNAIYETDFLGFSYGFRPGRSQHQALDALATAIYRKKVNWILDADIRAFFDSVSWEWLVRFLEHRIADRRLVRLIGKWLKAGVLEDGRLLEVERGTPQGAVISPVLANIYLHYVYDLWVQQWRRRHAGGEVIVVRYADDTVVGFQLARTPSDFWTSFGSVCGGSGWSCIRRRPGSSNSGASRRASARPKTSANRKPSPFSASRTSVERAGEGPSSSCGTPFVNGCGRSSGRSKRRYGG